MGTTFELPIKYLYDVHNNELVVENLEMLSRDLGFSIDGDLLEEGFCNEAEFVSVLETHSPDGEFTSYEGIISMTLYDYWDQEFFYFHRHCNEKKIPYNYYKVPECQQECTYYTFCRPNWNEPKHIDANEYGEAVVPINNIMKAINDQDEDLTDLEVLIKLTMEFEDRDPHSMKNHLRNWA